MNTVRKCSVYLGVACFIAGCISAAYAFLVQGNNGSYELGLSLCGAALFFVAPFAIIPARKADGGNRDRLELLGEFCASAFYAGVLIAISVMGFQYIEALFKSSGPALSVASQAGFAVFFASFAFSLVTHLSGAILVLFQLLGTEKEQA